MTVPVPMSDRTLRKLDRLVSMTGLSEEAILSMALTNLLACVRQAENDNTDDNFDLPRGASSAPVADASGEIGPAGG